MIYQKQTYSFIILSRAYSRPIMGYLVSKYAKNDSLYPKDPRKRGIVDQMLYFDAGSLHENMINCYVRIPILLCKTALISDVTFAANSSMRVCVRNYC